MSELATRPVNLEAAQVRAPAASLLEHTNLTSLQTLYWVAERLRPDVPFTNAVIMFHIAGAVDFPAFQKAFQCVLDASQALRSVVVTEQGIPRRQERPAWQYEMPLVDLSRHDAPQAALAHWVGARVSEPLDSGSRLIDAVLLKLAEDRYAWYLNQHHIIADASSYFCVFNYLAEAYVQIVRGGPASLAIPAFAEYVQRQRQSRTSAQWDKANAFWNEKLQCGDGVQFFSRATVKRTSRVERRVLELGPERSQRLRALIRRAGIASVSDEFGVYNVFAALFAAVVCQAGGQRCCRFVTPVHGRINENLRNMVGLVMELCPVEATLAERDSFATLIRRFGAQALRMMAHYPFGSQYMLANGFPDVMFNLHRMPRMQLDGMQVRPERMHNGHGTESFALHVLDMEEPAAFELHFYFHEEVFTEQQRKEVMGAYEHLVDLCLADAEQPIPNVLGVAAGEKPSQPAPLAAAAAEFAAPRDELERCLAEMWQDVLAVPRVGIRDNFFALGGDSFRAVCLFARIQEVFGRQLPISALIGAATVESLADSLRREPATHSWSYVKLIQPGSSQRRPLFAAPGAGNSIMVYQHVAKHLGPDQPLYAFQLRGINGEDDKFSSVEEMAAVFRRAMCEIQPEGPYWLAGYSFGGMVAYEIAQQLRQAGQQVGFLAIIDTRTQHPSLGFLHGMAWHIGHVMGWDVERRRVAFLALRQQLVSAQVVRRRWTRTARRRAAGLAQGEVPAWQAGASADEVRYFKRNFEINSRLLKYYIPRPYQGPITLFRAEIDDDNLSPIYAPHPYLGWDRLARGGLNVVEIPGDHHQMIREPHVKTLAESLRTRLDQHA